MNAGFPVAKRDIRRVFIANRGEIAVRIIRACKALGIETVVGVSEADIESMAAQMADIWALIGAPSPSESYLCVDRLVNAAKQNHCDAIHPGYGFLAESSMFAQTVTDAGLVFIGPAADSIDAMGDKITAINLAAEADVPCIPGSGALTDIEAAKDSAAEIGYPVMLKAAGGGGGRGMRVVTSEKDLTKGFNAAVNEAEAAFGNANLFVEKYIENARHVEFQVICDEHGNAVHLGERDCSIQRRHQKLIEEAPSPIVTTEMRTVMGNCAIQLAKNVDYTGAGTVEFVVDANSGAFYFLEMNTRIQVEHPVTEMISGFDLVAEQIRVACGLPLSFSQEDIRLNGHAIECRINAEDPEKDFMPMPGLIRTWRIPVGDGIRLDTHCFAGYAVPPYYDSLMGKLIVHGTNRKRAIAHMTDALENFEVSGVPTTIPFHRQVMQNQSFIAGKVTTRWVEDSFLNARQANQYRGQA